VHVKKHNEQSTSLGVAYFATSNKWRYFKKSRSFCFNAT